MVTIRDRTYKSVKFCDMDPRTPILCNQINQRLRLKLVNEMTVSNSAVVGSTNSGPKLSEFEARCSYQIPYQFLSCLQPLSWIQTRDDGMSGANSS